MKEKDLFERIRQDSETITPPDSLSPKAIEERLLKQKTGSLPDQVPPPVTDTSSLSGRKKKYRRLIQFGSMAAVFALTVTTASFYQNHLQSDNEASAAVKTAITQEEESMEANSLSETKDSADALSEIQNHADEETLDAGISDSVPDSVMQKQEAASVSDEDVQEELSDPISEETITAESSKPVTEESISEKASGAVTKETISDEASGNVTEKTILDETSGAVEEETISEKESDSVTRETLQEQFTYASSYSEIYQSLYEYSYSEYTYDLLSRNYEVYEDGIVYDAENAVEYDAVEESSLTAAMGSTSSADKGYSTTNLMEAGVDEGDIVKTDGQYIYILQQDRKLVILRADGAASSVVSTTSLPSGQDSWIEEMYLDGDLLSVLIGEYSTALEEESDIYYPINTRQVRLLTYDISDRENPVLTGSITQEGFYRDSRKKDGYLYLFSQYSPSVQESLEESTFIPLVNGKKAAAESFYLPDTLKSDDYLIISSVDLSQPDQVQDSKILVSGASNFYVSNDNIYIADETGSSSVRTTITKFHYASGQITGVAAGSVRGYLNDSFSMNEYNGYLRIVTTYYGDNLNVLRDLASRFTGEYYSENWIQHNGLYILDENLQKVGSIENLAEDESIRSARFFGDTGYFVTFRQTDPLFSVDLSDPANPRILGELKIPGFSTYLHFYGENQLLGLGYEADSSTGITTGLKLSMFDISDPSNVTETDRLVIPGITWCPSFENYKSILADPDKNLIGFYMDNRYLVFSYEAGTGFTREMIYDFYTDMLNEQVSCDTMRGLYIGDDFYLAGDHFLLTFAIREGFSKTGVLNF